MKMEARKVLSGLCYLSLFFAGFIFPLVVFLASGDEITKGHAKKALLSHLIPLIPIPLLVIGFFHDATRHQNELPVYTIITLIVIALITFVVAIWNIIKGVKVFREE
jgi:hypothetical protein